MQTNEELARRIRAGERDLLPELWKGVQGFVYYEARRWCRAWKQRRPTLEVEDLAQDGYIAMCEALEQYKPDQGSFVTWLKFPLLTAFSVEVGCRTPAQLKRPDNSPLSLDAPIAADSEGIALGELIEDPAASQAFEDADEQIYREQVAAVVSDAVEELPEPQKGVVRLRYYNGLTRGETAQMIGSTSESVRLHEKKALYTLRKNPAVREIHHGDRNLYRNTGYTSWKSTGCSVQELELLWKERA